MPIITTADALAEAGRILRGETRMLAEESHLRALQQLIREAADAFEREWREEGSTFHQLDIRDWLREARKVL